MTRKASDAAIERALVIVNAKDQGYWHERDEVTEVVADHVQALSDAIRAHFGDAVPASLEGFVLQVVVDPLDEILEEAFGYGSPVRAERLRVKLTERGFELRAIAAQGGGL